MYTHTYAYAPPMIHSRFRCKEWIMALGVFAGCENVARLEFSKICKTANAKTAPGSNFTKIRRLRGVSPQPG